MMVLEDHKERKVLKVVRVEEVLREHKVHKDQQELQDHLTKDSRKIFNL